MPDPPNPLDEPYLPYSAYLSIMRDHLHSSYVSPILGFSRSDYVIYFREEVDDDNNPKGWEIKLQRGKRILVLFNCSPLNGKRVVALTKRFCSFPKPYLKTLKIGMDLLLRKDAVRFYGIELDKIDVDLYAKKNKPEMWHHEISVVKYYEVTIFDPATKKKVTLTVRNCDTFTASEIAFKQLYGED